MVRKGSQVHLAALMHRKKVDTASKKCCKTCPLTIAQVFCWDRYEFDYMKQAMYLRECCLLSSTNCLTYYNCAGLLLSHTVHQYLWVQFIRPSVAAHQYLQQQFTNIFSHSLSSGTGHQYLQVQFINTFQYSSSIPLCTFHQYLHACSTQTKVTSSYASTLLEH